MGGCYTGGCIKCKWWVLETMHRPGWDLCCNIGKWLFCSGGRFHCIIPFQVADIFEEEPTEKSVLKALSAVGSVASANSDTQDLTLTTQLLENVTSFLLDFQKTGQDIMLNEVGSITSITLGDYCLLLCIVTSSSRLTGQCAVRTSHRSAGWNCRS